MAFTASSKYGHNLLNESSVDTGVSLKIKTYSLKKFYFLAFIMKLLLRFLTTKRLEVCPLFDELVKFSVVFRVIRLGVESFLLLILVILNRLS